MRNLSTACEEELDGVNIRTSVNVHSAGDSGWLGAEETFAVQVGGQTLLARAIVNYIGLPLNRLTIKTCSLERTR